VASTMRAYEALKARIAPGLRFNQQIYEEVLTAQVKASTVWLDAGCGRHLLPPWREDQERSLIQRAGIVVGCDVDEGGLRRHRSISRMVVADLERLPFKTGSVQLITSNMVVEHLERPNVVFSEFARILKTGGRVVIHTPNAHSHFVVGARLVPRWLKVRLVRRLDGREADEVFPAHYRANTRGRLRAAMTAAGLREESCRMVANDAVFALAGRIPAALELLYIRLTMTRAFRFLRVTILGTFVK
jgi:SAM-dependent methyltransferase